MSAILQQRDEAQLWIGAGSPAGGRTPKLIFVLLRVGDIQRATVQTDQPPLSIPRSSRVLRSDRYDHLLIEPSQRFRAETRASLRDAGLTRRLHGFVGLGEPLDAFKQAAQHFAIGGVHVERQRNHVIHHQTRRQFSLPDAGLTSLGQNRIDHEGFPFSYETFDGNRADVTTMETILRMVERKYGKARRIGVFDRGVVSEENLAAIRKRGGQYLVGTPRSQMKRLESELLQENWTRVREDVEIKQIAVPQGEETYILCRTSGRQEKEKAIRERFCTRLEKALRGLEKNIAQGRLKDRYKMERKLGRIQERYPQVNDLYQVALEDTAAGLRLAWEMKAERKQWRDLREGAYLLRSTCRLTPPRSCGRNICN